MNDYITLPNADYISKLRRSVEVNPDIWAPGSNTNETTLASLWSARKLTTAWKKALNTTYAIHRDYKWERAQKNINSVIVRGAILALVAYDDCAYMMESTPDELRLIIALSGDTNPAATLLYPVVDILYWRAPLTLI